MAKTVVSNSEVPHLWAHQTQDSARNSNGSLFFRGKAIFSYGAHFPIAQFVDNTKGETAVLLTTRSYSNTTARHKGEVRAAIHHWKPIFRVPLHDVPFIPTEHVANYQREITEAERALGKARNEDTSARRFSVLTEWITEANAFCEFFGLPERFTVRSDFDSLRATMAEESARERKVTKERKNQLTRQNADKIARWIAGESIQLPYGLDTVYLRIERNEVVTSKGARFPVAHAVRGLALIRHVMATGQEYRPNGHTLRLGPYTVDHIDVKGTVRAGCHVVRFSEIERIAAQLEVLWED